MLILITDVSDLYMYLNIDTGALSDSQAYGSGLKSRLLAPLRGLTGERIGVGTETARKLYLPYDRSVITYHVIQLPMVDLHLPRPLHGVHNKSMRQT